MTNGASAGGTAAAVAAAVADAIKASGAIVRVETTDFMTMLQKIDNPLVVYSESTFISTKYHYLTAYKGLSPNQYSRLSIDFYPGESSFTDLDYHPSGRSDLGIRVGDFFSINCYGRLRAHAFRIAAGLDQLAGKQ